MMVGMRLGTKYSTTMTELRSTSATLSSPACSFLLIRLSTAARYFTASLRRSISLTAIHQLCSDNLVENRHVWGNPEHLLAQFELFYGLSGHVIHCSRGHFDYLPHHMLLNHEQTTIGARHRALDQQQIALRIRLNHLQFLRCHTRIAHMTSHACSL